MSEQGLFKTVFSGFDKKAVLQYIQELSEQAGKAREELEGQLREKEEQIASLQSQLQEKEEQIAGLSADCELYKSRISELNGTQSSLSFRLEKQVQLTDEKDRELKIQQESNRQLQFKVESLEYKSRRYDEVAQEIGATLADARHNAAQISEQARTEANEMARRLSGELNAFRQEVSGMKSQMLGEMERLMDQVRGRLERLEEAAGSARCSFTTYEEVPEDLEQAAAQQQPEQDGSSECRVEDAVDKDAPEQKFFR